MSDTSALWPGDFYHLRESLPAEDRALLAELRAFLEAEVAPVINDYWTRAEFPHHLIPGLARLGIIGTSYHGHGFRGRSALLDGFIALELARVDPSIATFFGVHSGLSAGSIYLCGSEEQKARFVPSLASGESLAAYALTEAGSGSDSAAMRAYRKPPGLKAVHSFSTTATGSVRCSKTSIAVIMSKL